MPTVYARGSDLEPLEGGPRDAQLTRGFALGQLSDCGEPFRINPARRSAQPKPLVP